MDERSIRSSRFDWIILVWFKGVIRWGKGVVDVFFFFCGWMLVEEDGRWERSWFVGWGDERVVGVRMYVFYLVEFVLVDVFGRSLWNWGEIWFIFFFKWYCMFVWK